MKKTVAIVTVLGTLVGTGGAASWYVWGDELASLFSLRTGSTPVDDSPIAAPIAAAAPDPVYMPLDPPFLVNFEMNGALRFLQVSIDVMSTDDAVLESLRTHMAHVRNNVLLILSDQTLETLMSTSAKEDLREALLKEVRFVMTQRTGSPGIDALYFTNFVMQ